MTEAARCVVDFGFSEMNLNRIQGMCDVENLASARVLEKVDMRFEGILREYVHFKKAYSSVKMYAMLRSDWP